MRTHFERLYVGAHDALFFVAIVVAAFYVWCR